MHFGLSKLNVMKTHRFKNDEVKRVAMYLKQMFISLLSVVVWICVKYAKNVVRMKIFCFVFDQTRNDIFEKALEWYSP